MTKQTLFSGSPRDAARLYSRFKILNKFWAYTPSVSLEKDANKYKVSREESSDFLPLDNALLDQLKTNPDFRHSVAKFLLLGATLNLRDIFKENLFVVGLESIYSSGRHVVTKELAIRYFSVSEELNINTLPKLDPKSNFSLKNQLQKFWLGPKSKEQSDLEFVSSLFDLIYDSDLEDVILKNPNAKEIINDAFFDTKTEIKQLKKSDPDKFKEILGDIKETQSKLYKDFANLTKYAKAKFSEKKPRTKIEKKLIKLLANARLRTLGAVIDENNPDFRYIEIAENNSGVSRILFQDINTVLKRPKIKAFKEDEGRWVDIGDLSQQSQDALLGATKNTISICREFYQKIEKSVKDNYKLLKAKKLDRFDPSSHDRVKFFISNDQGKERELIINRTFTFRRITIFDEYDYPHLLNVRNYESFYNQIDASIKKETVNKDIGRDIISFLKDEKVKKPGKKLKDFERGINGQEFNPKPETPYRDIGIKFEMKDFSFEKNDTKTVEKGLKITEIFSPQLERFYTKKNSFINNDVLKDKIITEIKVKNAYTNDYKYHTIKNIYELAEDENKNPLEVIISYLRKKDVITFKTHDGEEYHCDNRQNKSAIFVPKVENNQHGNAVALSELLNNGLVSLKTAQKAVDSVIKSKDYEPSKLIPGTNPLNAQALGSISRKLNGKGDPNKSLLI